MGYIYIHNLKEINLKIIGLPSIFGQVYILDTLECFFINRISTLMYDHESLFIY